MQTLFACVSVETTLTRGPFVSTTAPNVVQSSFRPTNHVAESIFCVFSKVCEEAGIEERETDFCVENTTEHIVPSLTFSVDVEMSSDWFTVTITMAMECRHVEPITMHHLYAEKILIHN